MTPEFIQTIARAAALHDVGKVGIPDSILLKPGKLTDGRIRDHEDPHPDRRGTAGGTDRKSYGEYAMISMGADVAWATTSGGTGRAIPRA